MQTITIYKLFQINSKGILMTKELQNEIVIYQSDDGRINLDVKLENETIWLTQKQMAELFGVKAPAINKHLNNIYNEGELDKNSTISILEIVQKEGNRLVSRNTATILMLLFQ